MSDISVKIIPLVQAGMGAGEFKPMFPKAQAAADAPPQNVNAKAPQEDENSFEQGVALGIEKAEAAFAEERIALQNLIASADVFQPEASDEIALLIGKTVNMLVQQIIGDFVPDKAWLEERIAKAVGMIAECDAARTIWMHPKDIALLNTEAMKLHFMEDKNAERGSIRVDCSHGWVESGHCLYLEELTAELGLKGTAA